MLSFKELFEGKLKEVFLYITDRCNLRCSHCYMPNTKNTDMPFDIFDVIMKEVVRLGASKVTLLGGEPTLHPLLPSFINTLKNLNVDYIRLDTNGQFKPELLENPDLRSLNDISFSLEGIDPKTHGAIRTMRNYYSVMDNIKKALSLNYIVRVTMTVNSLNLSQVEQIVAMLNRMGVSVLNLHLISKSGRARHNKHLLVKEEEWMEFYQQIVPNLTKYNIRLKVPQRYTRENDRNIENIITCEAAKASRLAITPDLRVYACPLLLDRNRYFARFEDKNLLKFVYTKDHQKNIILKDKIKGPICPLLMKENYKTYKKKKIIPLCISYKPTVKKKCF